MTLFLCLQFAYHSSDVCLESHALHLDVLVIILSCMGWSSSKMLNFWRGEVHSIEVVTWQQVLHAFFCLKEKLSPSRTGGRKKPALAYTLALAYIGRIGIHDGARRRFRFRSLPAASSSSLARLERRKCRASYSRLNIPDELVFPILASQCAFLPLCCSALGPLRCETLRRTMPQPTLVHGQVSHSLTCATCKSLVQNSASQSKLQWVVR
jgi:hypothetical protein